MNPGNTRMVTVPENSAGSLIQRKPTTLLGQSVGLWLGCVRNSRTDRNGYDEIFMPCLILSRALSSGGLMVKTGWVTQAVDTGALK